MVMEHSFGKWDILLTAYLLLGKLLYIEHYCVTKLTFTSSNQKVQVHTLYFYYYRNIDIKYKCIVLSLGNLF